MNRLTYILIIGIGCSQARPFDTGRPVDTPADTGAAVRDGGEDAEAGLSSHDDAGAVVINELLAASSDDGPDWIELYNDGPDTADLSGWLIADDADEAWALPEGTRLRAGAFLLLYADDAQGTESDGLHVPFKLSRDGETVTLTDADADAASHVTYPALEDDEAYARTTDGAAEWAIIGAGGTPAAANGR